MSQRRTLISDDQLRQIEVLAGYGLTEAAIAHVIGVPGRTFRRRKNDAAVAEALARGQAKAQGIIAKALFEKAKDGDLGAIVWWEKTRAGRSDRQAVEHSGPGGSAIPVLHAIAQLPPSEAERLAALPPADFEAEIARLAE